MANGKNLMNNTDAIFLSKLTMKLTGVVVLLHIQSAPRFNRFILFNPVDAGDIQN